MGMNEPMTREPWDDVHLTGPDTLAGRYLRRFWQPLCLSERIAPGRARPVRMFSEDFTVYRSQGGTPHVVDFRCAHRGTQMSIGWVEDDNIRCFYHGWAYDPNGQCVEQPGEPEPFCEKVRIKAYPTYEYVGLIFAYLGEGEPPALPHFDEFDKPGVITTTAGEVVPCNYFNRIDQAPDVMHPTFAHNQEGRGIPRVEAEETDFGIETRGIMPDGQVRYLYFHMPTLNMGRYAEMDALHYRMPIDDEHYVSFNTSITYAADDSVPEWQYYRQTPARKDPRSPKEISEAILRGDMHVDEIIALGYGNDVQDYIITVGQGRVAPRGKDHLGREDVGIVLLRSIWKRELKALAEGRPLKQWHRPAELVAPKDVKLWGSAAPSPAQAWAKR